jgi:hypothetical protein
VHQRQKARQEIRSTLWRTWGTRPVPSAFLPGKDLYALREAAGFWKNVRTKRTMRTKWVRDGTELFGHVGLDPI